MAKTLKGKMQAVKMDLIDEPKSVSRLNIEKGPVEELAKSIYENGLLQPIVLRVGNGRFEIIAGHRRFLAHRLLEKEMINAFASEMTDQEAIFARATENLARVDLTPLEESAIYGELVDVHGLSFEEIGKKMGKTAGTIKRRLDLLRMPPILQQAVHNKQISMSVAEELWPIANVTDLEYYMSFAVENGCTKSVAREWCREWKDGQRRRENPGEVPGGGASPQEPRPYYVACDLCQGPAEMDKMIRMAICTDCHKLIKENM